METIDMLWDQRVFELDGEKHIVNFYCCTWKRPAYARIPNDMYNDPDDVKMYEAREEYYVNNYCFFECEGTCTYPSVNPKCPDEDSTEDECPLKKLYKE